MKSVWIPALLAIGLCALPACDDSDAASTPSDDSGASSTPTGEDWWATPDSTCEGIPNTGSTPPRLVAAYLVCPSGMMERHPWDYFSWAYGKRSAYLYDDGTAIYRGTDEMDPPYTRLHVKTVDAAGYCSVTGVLDVAGMKTEPIGDDWAHITSSTDARKTVFYGDAGPEVGSALVGTYGSADDADMHDADAWEIHPHSLAMHEKLVALKGGGAQSTSDRIGLYSFEIEPEGGSQNCPHEDATPWPFDEIELTSGDEDVLSAGPGHLALVGESAEAVRAWWREEYLSPPCDNKVLVRDGEKVYELYIFEPPAEWEDGEEPLGGCWNWGSG